MGMSPRDLRQIDRFLTWLRLWLVSVVVILSIGYWQGVFLSVVYSLFWMHVLVATVCLLLKWVLP